MFKLPDAVEWAISRIAFIDGTALGKGKDGGTKLILTEILLFVS